MAFINYSQMTVIKISFFYLRGVAPVLLHKRQRREEEAYLKHNIEYYLKYSSSPFSFDLVLRLKLILLEE